VRAILDIGENLGLDVVAAGIETNQQHAALTRSGCVYGQGSLYHRAVNANRMRAILTRQKQARTGSLSSGGALSARLVGSR
jgi:EAL domain-containing protein (putative c-di-GMP-specific phosphodiesterase class I)